MRQIFAHQFSIEKNFIGNFFGSSNWISFYFIALHFAPINSFFVFLGNDFDWNKGERKTDEVQEEDEHSEDEHEKQWEEKEWEEKEWEEKEWEKKE